MILEQRMLGGNGCLYVSGSSTGNTFYAIVVNEDCTLQELTTVSGQDLLLQYDLLFKPIKQGMLIPAFNGDPIATINVDSGSVIGYGYNILG